MIHNLIIATESGVKLFEKQFMTPVGSSSNLLASLLTAVLIKGKRELEHTIEYFEMERLALTIVNDGSRKVFCALITDTSLGHEFPKLIATQTLRKYIEEASKSSPLHTAHRRTRSSLPSDIGPIFTIKSPLLASEGMLSSYSGPQMFPQTYVGQRVFPSLLKNPKEQHDPFPKMKFNGLVSEEEAKEAEELQLNVDPYLFQAKLREAFLSVIHLILNERK